jgi:hypothetical protein
VSKPALGFKPKTTRDDEDKTYTQKQSYTEKQSPVSVKRSAQPKRIFFNICLCLLFRRATFFKEIRICVFDYPASSQQY